MHIELTELLRCPSQHPAEHLVLSTGTMLGRSVRSGVVGCPVCRREFPIIDGIVDFGGIGAMSSGKAGGEVQRTETAAAARPATAAQTLQALLDLGGPGGTVALLGLAAPRAGELAALMSGIHFVGINAPRDLAESPVLSVIRAGDFIPLRDAVVRGVVVGPDAARAPWLAEAVRVLLPRRRLVVEGTALPPPGATRLAEAEGLWVGEKS